jgi:hypothetical protein
MANGILFGKAPQFGHTHFRLNFKAAKTALAFFIICKNHSNDEDILF